MTKLQLYINGFVYFRSVIKNFMEPLLNTSSFILLITAVLGMLGGIILGVYSFRKKNHNGWLAAYYFSAGYAFLVTFLIYSRLIANIPWVHTYRTGYIAGFLLFPFSYLYIRNVLRQKLFETKDLLHFIPSLLFFIDFLPFYLQPAAIKLEQASMDAVGINTTWSNFSQGWLGIGEYYQPARIILITIYWILEVVMLQKINLVKGGSNLKAENKELIQWVKIFILLQVLFFIPYYITVLIGGQQNFYVSAHTYPAVGTAIGMIILLLQPAILYGLKGALVQAVESSSKTLNMTEEQLATEEIKVEINVQQLIVGEQVKEEDLLSREKPMVKQFNYFPLQKLQTINEIVENHIEINQSFKNKGYTTRDLATEMNIQPYVLSAVINQVHQTNFNDFLNRYRINYAKNLIEKGQGKMLTLEGLADQCGFNNRNSFTTAFKKHTSFTPSAYIKGNNVITKSEQIVL